MNVWLSVGLTLVRVVLLSLAARELLLASVVPRGRIRRRHIAVGVAGLVGSLVRL